MQLGVQANLQENVGFTCWGHNSDLANKGKQKELADLIASAEWQSSARQAAPTNGPRSSPADVAARLSPPSSTVRVFGIHVIHALLLHTVDRENPAVGTD